MSVVTKDISNMEKHRDVVACRGCGVLMAVEVVPDLPKNKWTCTNCGHRQLWIPSEEYKKEMGISESPVIKKNAVTNKQLSFI